MHLIVVDDDEGVSTFIAKVAHQHGCTVEVASNETEFRARYRSRHPDAVMLDLQLGTSDGIEQLRFLQRERFDGPLVVMSGFDARVRTAAQELGQSLGLTIATTLEKPIRAAMLREVLGQLERQIAAGAPRAHGLAEAPSASPTIDYIDPREVDQALSDHQIELYLQPILKAADLTVDHFEGLARWQHPSFGPIPPVRFIPAAERNAATIDRLTDWVIEAALGHYRRLAELGYRVPIAVNVSGMNLRTLDFPDRVAVLVERCGAPPSALTFEVTETVAMRDPKATSDILTRLRLKGFELALDDFGTGNSSLTALRTMPFSEIKIDKSFVQDMLTSHDSLTIVKSVIDLARNMRLTTVAEGVESEEVARRLIGFGCDKLQGYLYSRPLPLDRLVAWLEARRLSQSNS